MRLTKYILATAELLLVFPAALFMLALFVRNIQPLQFEPAHTAQQIVNWYASSARIGLWLLLIAMPLAVVIIGATNLFRQWTRDANLRQASQQALALVRAHLETLLIATATSVAGFILAIVALHVLTD
jgi:hypothetical protein